MGVSSLPSSTITWLPKSKGLWVIAESIFGSLGDYFLYNTFLGKNSLVYAKTPGYWIPLSFFYLTSEAAPGKRLLWLHGNTDILSCIKITKEVSRTHLNLKKTKEMPRLRVFFCAWTRKTMNLHFAFIAVMIEIPFWRDEGTICSPELRVRESDLAFGWCSFFEMTFLTHITCNAQTFEPNEKIRFRVTASLLSLLHVRAPLE